MAEHVCPTCGRASPVTERFCGSCGTALGAHPSMEERRWVTVLFADLSGFTRLSERMDPEEVRSVADAFQARAGSVVARLGGIVAGVMADGVLAVFGAPVAHEDDAE